MFLCQHTNGLKKIPYVEDVLFPKCFIIRVNGLHKMWLLLKKNFEKFKTLRLIVRDSIQLYTACWVFFVLDWIDVGGVIVYPIFAIISIVYCA